MRALSELTSVSSVSLLDKFSGIEIENSTRLAEDDKGYCEQQHELYVKILRHYKNMFEKLQTLKQEDTNFYTSVAGENEYYTGSYICKFYEHKFVDIDKDAFATTSLLRKLTHTSERSIP